MTTSTTAKLPGGADNPGTPALICTRCGDADGLLIEAIGAIIPVMPGFVSIEYSCSACGSFYGHGATVQQVAELLNAGATAPGVLHFGHHFIHCGEPMEDIAEDTSRLHPPAGTQNGPPVAMPLRTRLLKCHCGFQLDVPL